MLHRCCNHQTIRLFPSVVFFAASHSYVDHSATIVAYVCLNNVMPGVLLLLHNRTNYCDVETSEINNFVFRPDQVVVWWLRFKYIVALCRTKKNWVCREYFFSFRLHVMCVVAVVHVFSSLPESNKVCFDSFHRSGLFAWHIHACDETKRKLKNKSKKTMNTLAFCCTLPYRGNQECVEPQSSVSQRFWAARKQTNKTNLNERKKDGKKSTMLHTNM